MSIKAEFINENPNIDIENMNYKTGNFIIVKIGDLEISLSEKDAKYLSGEIDAAVYCYEESKEGLEEKIGNLEDELEELKEEAATTYDGVGYYGQM